MSNLVNPYRFVTVGGAFLPTDFANLELWFDASDLSTVTTDGEGVTDWADKSVNGFDLSQGTTALKPQQSTDSGDDGILFDGVNDVLNRTSTVISGTNGFTYFQAYRLTSATTGGDTMFIGLDSATSAIQYTENSSNTAQFLINVTSGSQNNINITSFKGTTRAAIVGRGASSGSDGLLEFDEGTSATDANIGVTRGINGTISFGAQSTGGAATPMYLFECGLYSRSLNDTDFDTLLAYLADKWSV